MLTAYNHLKRENNESIKNFSARFNSIYNSLPVDYKPPEGMAKLHFAEAFDGEFALFSKRKEISCFGKNDVRCYRSRDKHDVLQKRKI